MFNKCNLTGATSGSRTVYTLPEHLNSLPFSCWVIVGNIQLRSRFDYPPLITIGSTGRGIIVVMSSFYTLISPDNCLYIANQEIKKGIPNKPQKPPFYGIAFSFQRRRLTNDDFDW